MRSTTRSTAPTIALLAAAASAMAAFSTLSADAAAQEQPSSLFPSRAVPAPANAFELSVGTGYTQGFGMLQSGVGLPSVVSPGLAVDLGIGYRVDPRWGLFWTGQYAQLTSERALTAHGFTTALAVQYHVAPWQPLDPWLELGTGYRVIVEDQAIGPDVTTHGFELVRLKIGVDYRPMEMVSVGPVIGAGLDMFFFQNVPGVSSTISDPRASTFVFAGLQGRFDVGGRYPERGSTAAMR